VGVLGVAFKPGSDDVRDSPALEVAARIRALGARVAVFDPAAMDRARKVHPELDYTGSVLGAARDADALLVLTEWPEFSVADPEVLAKTVARRAIVDARHALDAAAWRDCGWDYHAPGRPSYPPGAPDALPGRPADVRPHQAELHAAAVRFLAAAV
jgi:UDPglucose 6-dehydrogenase